jgi:transcriptional regulator with XRE-family HTH domain
MMMATAPKKQPRKVQAAAAAFGARLKAARNAESLTLREVSERSGLSITYLSDLERGELQNPTLKALEAIGGAVSTPLDELLGVEGGGREARGLPPALEAFSMTDVFRDAIAAEASRRKRDEDEIRRTWLATLERIEVDGRRPKEPMDYRLIFESIRRAISS